LTTQAESIACAKDKKGIEASNRKKYFFMECIFRLAKYTKINSPPYHINDE